MAGESFDFMEDQDEQQQVPVEAPTATTTPAADVEGAPAAAIAATVPGRQQQQVPVEQPTTDTNAPTAEPVIVVAAIPPPSLVEQEDAAPREVFTRAEEHRMTELTKREVSTSEAPLTDEERAELRTLAEKYQRFIAAGEQRLRDGVSPNESQHGPTTFAEGFSAIASTAATVAVSASQAAVHVGKGAFFWGTLVATAVPGYFGKKLGATERFDHWNWLSDKLILGALPVVTQVGTSGNHLQLLKEQCEKRKRKLGLVVACLQAEEMEGFGLSVLTFAQKQHWQEFLGVTEYEHVPMPDFGAEVAFDTVKHAVDRMHQTMHDKGEAVYVHCKAGKGRSWMVVMCYLLTYGGMDWQTASITVESGRHQVHPGMAQQQFAQEFARRFNQTTAASASSAPAAAATSAPASANSHSSATESQ